MSRQTQLKKERLKEKRSWMVFTWMVFTMLMMLIVSISAGATETGAAENGAASDSWARSVEDAVSGARVDVLQDLRAELLERLPGSDTPNKERYNLAYVNWRLCALLKTKADRERLLEEAQKELEMVTKAEADNSDALALLAGIMGQRIGEKPMRGMTLGSKSSSLLKKAARLAPNNPRVALQQGVSHFHTPSMWGGGLDKAMPELERAVALFAQRPSDEPWPNWGQLDALAWLGQALARQGKTSEARAIYQQALAINPKMGWIRHRLLPALDGEGTAER